MSRMEERRLDDIYALLPKIECQKKCYEACGPIMMSRVEWRRIQNEVGYKPVGETLACPLLVNNLCSAYRARPLICRLYGLVPEMKCPFGCIPERWMSDEEVDKVFKMVEGVSK